MKKILSLFLAVLLVVGLLPMQTITAFAADPAFSLDITADAHTLTTLEANDTVTVKVVMPAVSEVGGIGFDLDYDVEKFTYNSDASITGISSKLTTSTASNPQAGKVRVTAAATTNQSFDADTVALQATFTVKSDVSGTASFSLSEITMQKFVEYIPQDIAWGTTPSASVTIPAPVQSDEPVFSIKVGAVPDDGTYTAISENTLSYNFGDTLPYIQVSQTGGTAVTPSKYLWKMADSATAADADYVRAGTASQTKSARYSLGNSGLKNTLGEKWFACEVTYTPEGGTEKTVTVGKVKVSVDITQDILNTKALIKSQPVGGSWEFGTAGDGVSDFGAILQALPDSSLWGEGSTMKWFVSTDGGEKWTETADYGTDPTGASDEYSLVLYTLPLGTYKFKATASYSTKNLAGDTLTASVDSDVVTVNIISSTATWEGEGTEVSPYLLKTTADIKELSDRSSLSDFSGKFFKFDADIVLPADWTPIGTQKMRFAGTIDGNNHLLTVPEGEKALIGCPSQATLKNLNIYGTKINGNGVVDVYTTGKKGVTAITIENVTLKSGTQTLASGFVGGYAPGDYPVVIRNCTVEEGVTIGYDGTKSNIGSFGGDFNGTIVGCVSHATVKGVNFVGGISGAKGQTMGDYIIVDCVFDGSVIATGNDVGGISGSGYSGTIFGLASAPNTPCVTVKNCLVSGSVTGADHVGGILGSEPGIRECWNNGVGYIQNNLFTGTLTATGESKGAIVGYMNALNNMNVISGNYYLDSSAAKGIGSIAMVQTPETLPGTGTGWNNYSVKYGRTDDPTGADADKLAKAVTSAELSDGTVLALLNSGANSSKNWVAGALAPTINASAGKHLIQISCAALSTMTGVSQEAQGTDILSGKTLTLTYNDGTTETAPATSAAKGYTITSGLIGKSIPAAINYQGQQLVFNLSIKNTPPSIVSGKGTTAAESVARGETYTLDLSTIFEDKDGDSLSYTVAVDGAEGISAAKDYSFVPTKAQGEMHTLVFSANDGTSDSGDYTVTITVGAPVPIEVTVRSQVGNAYLNGFSEKVSVTMDLAESYGFSDSVTNGVSALDVLVRAHELIFGEDFTKETASEYLVVPASGFISKIFGTETYASGFLINEGFPNDGTASSYGGGYNGTTVTTQKVAANDVVDFLIYQDTDYYSDEFSWVSVESARVAAGYPFTVSVKSSMYMMGYMYKTPADFKNSAKATENAMFAWVNPATGAVTPIESVVSKADGTAAITAPKTAGTYYLTAISNSEEDLSIIMNPAEITVGEPVHPTKVEITKTETTIAKNSSETLIATVSPLDATDKSVTWSSSDKTVATVSDEGVVTGVKSGIATITATTVDGEKTAECAVTVTNAAPARKEGVAATAAADTSKASEYTLDLSTIFEDSDGDALTYTVAIDGADPVSAEAEYSFTATAAKGTTNVLVFKANDGEADSETYTVTLSVLNSVPNIKGEASKEGIFIAGGETADFDIKTKFEDADEDVLTCSYRMRSKTGSASDFGAFSGWSSVSADFALEKSVVGTYEYEFKANDGEADSEVYTLALSIYDPAAKVYTTTINVAPSTAGVEFYSGSDALLSLDGVTDSGVVGKYHQYVITVPEGVYSYRAVDGENDLGGMSFDIPIDDASGVQTGESSLTLVRVNYYTTNAAITSVGDYSLNIIAGAKHGVTAGEQYIDSSNRVVTPTLLCAKGNALLYNWSVTLNGTAAETLGVSPSANQTFAATLSGTQNKTFNLAALKAYRITAPEGATVKVFNQVNNYNNEEVPVTLESSDEAAHTKTWKFDSAFTNLTYRVSAEGEVTQAGYFKSSAESIVVTFPEGRDPASNISELSDSVKKYEDRSVLLNVDNENATNELNLAVGETYRLRAFRAAWEITNNVTGNILIQPDFHYQVLSGSDVISVSPVTDRCTGNASGNWMDITAQKAGTAVIAVYYDAIDIGGNTSFNGTYGATDPERYGIAVITVGADSSIDWNPVCSDGYWDSEFDTVYYFGEKGTFTFKPSSASSVTVQNAYKTTLGTPVGVTRNSDGSYDVPVTDGANIIAVTTASGTDYMVVRAKKITYTLKNETTGVSSSDGASFAVSQGDSVSVTLNGINQPIPKMAGMYNPGYMGTGKVSFELNEKYLVTSKGTQYDLVTNNTVTFTAYEEGEYTLSEGTIPLTQMGFKIGYHRTLGDGGCGTNFNALEQKGFSFGSIEDISFNVSSKEDSDISYDDLVALKTVKIYHGVSAWSNSFSITTAKDNNNVNWTSTAVNDQFALCAEVTAKTYYNKIQMRYWYDGDAEKTTVDLKSGVPFSDSGFVADKTRILNIELLVTPGDSSLGATKVYSYVVCPGTSNLSYVHPVIASLTASDGTNTYEVESSHGTGIRYTETEYFMNIGNAAKITLNGKQLQKYTNATNKTQDNSDTVVLTPYKNGVAGTPVTVQEGGDFPVAVWTASELDVSDVDTLKIEVTSYVSGSNAKRTYTVAIHPSDVAIAAKDSSSTELDDGVLNMSTGSFELKAVVEPAGAAEFFGASWSSSMPNVATVDKSGKVTAVGTGIAMISLSVDGKSSTILVEVVKNGEATVNDAANLGNIAEAILPETAPATLTPVQKAQLEAIAEAVQNMKDSEKAKLSDKFIEQLDSLGKAAGYNVTLKVTATSSDKVPEAERIGTAGHSAIGLIAAAGTSDLGGKTIELKIDQVAAESGMKYTFKLELDLENSKVDLASPVIITVKMPEGYVHSTSYKVKHTLNSGSVEWLPITYNKEANTITFRANKFSTFSVGNMPSNYTGGGVIHIIGSNSANAGEENPNTGYEAPVSAIIASAMLLAAAAIASGKRRK